MGSLWILGNNQWDIMGYVVGIELNGGMSWRYDHGSFFLWTGGKEQRKFINGSIWISP